MWRLRGTTGSADRRCYGRRYVNDNARRRLMAPPPPARPMRPQRIEALRAAAKVHEGRVSSSPTEATHERAAVLATAATFEVWLTEQ